LSIIYMLVTFKTQKHIHDVTNMFILFTIFFWIKLLLKLPNILTNYASTKSAAIKIESTFVKK
jgi:hypothetical protein